jgi:hypothetical protein
LRAVVRLWLLWVLVLGSFAPDVGFRFHFALVIGISFRCAATIAVTTEAPPQQSSRRGRIPKRSSARNWTQYRSVLREEASPFWIILLLIWGDRAQPKIKLAMQGLSLTMSAFGGKADMLYCSANVCF